MFLSIISELWGCLKKLLTNNNYVFGKQFTNLINKEIEFW